MGRNFTGLIVLVVLGASIALVAIRNNMQPNEPETVAFAPARSASEDIALPPDPPAARPTETVGTAPAPADSPPAETVVIREPVVETAPPVAPSPVTSVTTPPANDTTAVTGETVVTTVLDQPIAVSPEPVTAPPAVSGGPTVDVVRPAPDVPMADVAAETPNPGLAPLTFAEPADTAALSEAPTAGDIRPLVVEEAPVPGVVDTSPRQPVTDAPATPEAARTTVDPLPEVADAASPDAASPDVAPGAGEDAEGTASLLGRFNRLFGDAGAPETTAEDPAGSVREELERLAALLDTPLAADPPAGTGAGEPAPVVVSPADDAALPAPEIAAPEIAAPEVSDPEVSDPEDLATEGPGTAEGGLAEEAPAEPAPRIVAALPEPGPVPSLAEPTLPLTEPAASLPEPVLSAPTVPEAPAEETIVSEPAPIAAPPPPAETVVVPVEPGSTVSTAPPEPVAEVPVVEVAEPSAVVVDEPRAGTPPAPQGPVADEPVTVDVVAPEPSPSEVLPEPPTVVALAPAPAPAPDPGPEQVEREAPDLAAFVMPTFDIVRVEPSGDVVAAGLADPGANVEMLDGLETLATARANESGEWAIVLDSPLAPGAHDLSLRTTTDGGSMATLSDQRVAVSVPERGQSGVLVVVNTSDGPSEVLQVPVASQPAEPRVAPPPGVIAPGDEVADEVADEADAPEIVRDVAVTSVEADTAGTIYVTGTASTDEPVRVYLDNRPLGEATPMADGLWALEVPREVQPGSHEVRADQIDAAGDVVARAAVPFEREVEVLELRPVASVGAAGGTEAEGSVPGMRTVVIQRGDNLWKLSRRIYGRGVRYANIYEANRDQITDPRWIYPGQVFLVPEGNTAWPETAAPVD